MGIEPDPNEIPIEIESLSYESQIALTIFRSLPDKLEGMSGSWLGKDFSGLGTILDIYEVDNRRLVFDLMNILIVETSKHYQREQKQKASRKGRK